MSSAKSFGSIPISSCRCRSMPDFCSKSIDSGANMSSLHDYVSNPEQHEDTVPRTEPLPSNAPRAELEVELPSGNVLGKVTVLIRERDPNLDDLEKVDVTPHRLVVVVRGCLERPDWPRDYSRELRILCIRKEA